MTDGEHEEENTYVFDTESATEMARLIDQDRRLTQGMGGAMVGFPELAAGSQIVDLACGPGGWAMDVAYARPDIDVAGVDVSKTMIRYANARARSQELNNVTFGIMDITQPLEFSDASFDLVNARALIAVLKREAWQPFIAECFRILKPGGTLRLTEGVDFGVTNSPAVERMHTAGTAMLKPLGYSFSVDGRTFGLMPVLPRLLREGGFQNLRTLGYAIEFSAGTPAWIDYYHNYEIAFLQSKSTMIKLGLITEEEFDRSYQQLFIDMNRPDFGGIAMLASVIATKPA